MTPTVRRTLIALSFVAAFAIGAGLGGWFMVDWFEDALAGNRR